MDKENELPIDNNWRRKLDSLKEKLTLNLEETQDKIHPNHEKNTYGWKFHLLKFHSQIWSKMSSHISKIEWYKYVFKRLEK